MSDDIKQVRQELAEARRKKFQRWCITWGLIAIVAYTLYGMAMMNMAHRG